MKKMFLFAATAAIAMSSCSKNEVMEIATPNDNPYAIGFSTGMFATKAGETTTGSLNTSGQVVTLYSTESDLNALSFTSTGSDWTQNDTKKWADVDFTSPVSVYSMHTGAAPVALTATATDAAAAAFTVKDTPVAQEDLVYYAGKLAAIPTGSKISATFKHALSRIKMSQTAATSPEVWVAPTSQIKLVNAKSVGTPTIDIASSVSWASLGTPATHAYDASKDMFIIPQDAESAVNATATPKTVTGMYVESIFYTTISSVNHAGYAKVSDYTTDNPGAIVFVDGTNADGVYDTTADSTDALVAVDKPMCVKGAFPFSSSFTFVDAKYYNLALDYFGAGVVIAEGGYFTEDGKKITIIGGGKEPEVTDPVNPDEEDLIGLTVTVNAWPGTTGQDL